MNRRTFLHASAAVGAQGAATLALAAAPGPAARPHKSTEAARRIAKAAVAAMAMQRKDWEQGILAQAFLDAGDRERVILLTRAAMVQQAKDGRMGVVVEGSPTDPAMGGPAYAQAAAWTGDAAMHEAVSRMLTWIRDKAPRRADGVLYHVFGAPEMWSDGINGAPPFLSAMGLHKEAIQQIEGYRERLWNPEKKLLAHIWDEGKGQFKDGAMWGGGNGWAAAGLARVLRTLPSDFRRERARLAEFAREILDGCLAHQRQDGLFHNVVEESSSFVETNLAQMLAFAAYEGVHAGWLPAAYKEHADRMRTGARTKMDTDGFVQGACSAPEFDRPGVSTEAQAFCILMEAAGERLE